MSFFDSLTSVLDPVAKIGSFVPGPHQPFAAGYTGARSVQQSISGDGGEGGAAGDASSGGGGGFGLQDALGLVSKYGGPVAGILSLLQGRRLNNEALEAQREAMNFARQRQQETEPLRAMAIESLTGATPEAPRLSETFVDPTNPFSSPSQALNLSLPSLASLQGKAKPRSGGSPSRASTPSSGRGSRRKNRRRTKGNE